MATRKAKSISDINKQLGRIIGRSWAYNTPQAEKRAKQAEQIAITYRRNIRNTKTYKNDLNKTANYEFGEGYKVRSARKYVNYNTDKAKAASNG